MLFYLHCGAQMALSSLSVNCCPHSKLICDLLLNVKNIKHSFKKKKLSTLKLETPDETRPGKVFFLA